jgi:hypothetical protein
MFGGYLTGPNHGRPAIELAEAEKTKGLLERFDADDLPLHVFLPEAQTAVLQFSV